MEFGLFQVCTERRQEAECSWPERESRKLLGILESDPFQNPPPEEKLVGDLSGAYSRRINIQHRLVYEVFQKEKTVRVIKM